MSIFNEDTRVKLPATIQFLRLGYEYQSLRAMNGDIDINFKTKEDGLYRPLLISVLKYIY